jgi:hypothetical protein
VKDALALEALAFSGRAGVASIAPDQLASGIVAPNDRRISIGFD